MSDFGDGIARLIRQDVSRTNWQRDRERAEIILKKRRDRYREDPEYRDRIKEAVRKRRASMTPSNQKRSFNQDKFIFDESGRGIYLISSGKAARLIGISVRTLHNWEKRGWIPQNHLKDHLGRHWYPLEFVEFLSGLAMFKKDCSSSSWISRVKEEWQVCQQGSSKLPVVGSKARNAL